MSSFGKKIINVIDNYKKVLQKETNFFIKLDLIKKDGGSIIIIKLIDIVKI
jgi:uncharacterized protein YlaN (UPF0358 family)